MKICFIDSYYPEFLRTLTLGTGSYKEELDKVLARNFGTSNFYSREFRKIGWEAIDIIANYDALRDKWCNENNWQRNYGYDAAITRAQIEAFHPDVVFIQDFSFFNALHLADLAEKYILVGQLSCAFDDTQAIKKFHTIFTSLPHYIPKLKALGVNAVYMPLAFHPITLGVDWRMTRETWERPIDVSFVGGIGWQWKQGLEVLEAVAREIPTFQWYGYGYEQLSPTSPLRPCYMGQAWGDRMYEIYQRSKIVINRHGEIAENYANNMRMYEATGCGAVLVTEDRDNLEDDLLSVPGIVTYNSPSDAVRQIKVILDDWDEKGSALGLSAQRNTLNFHTYAHRVPKIAEVLTNAMTTA